MSVITIKSPKHCANKGGINFNKFYRRLFYILSTLFSTLLLLILLVWVILHPTKPQFSLKQTDIYQLNLSRPHVINSSIQITLLSTNPNTQIGIFYDELQAYASYKSQQITTGSFLPPFYQGHEDINVLTAALTGTGLPVAPSFGYEVQRDQTIGKLVMSVKVNGRIRWKVGSWVSGKYRLNINCVAMIDIGPTIPSVPLSSRQGSKCSTSI